MSAAEGQSFEVDRCCNHRHISAAHADTHFFSLKSKKSMVLGHFMVPFSQTAVRHDGSLSGKVLEMFASKELSRSPCRKTKRWVLNSTLWHVKANTPTASLSLQICQTYQHIHKQSKCSTETKLGSQQATSPPLRSPQMHACRRGFLSPCRLFEQPDALKQGKVTRDKKTQNKQSKSKTLDVAVNIGATPPAPLDPKHPQCGEEGTHPWCVRQSYWSMMQCEGQN